MNFSKVGDLRKFYCDVGQLSLVVIFNYLGIAPKYSVKFTQILSLIVWNWNRFTLLEVHNSIWRKNLRNSVKINVLKILASDWPRKAENQSESSLAQHQNKLSRIFLPKGFYRQKWKSECFDEFWSKCTEDYIRRDFIVYIFT